MIYFVGGIPGAGESLDTAREHADPQAGAMRLYPHVSRYLLPKSRPWSMNLSLTRP